METKMTGTQHELMSAFEAFRDANDQRLSEIERKSSADCWKKKSTGSTVR